MKKIRKILAGTVMCLMVVALAAKASALGTFTMTPMNKELTASPGKVVSGTVTITNTGEETVGPLIYEVTPYWLDEENTPMFDGRLDGTNEVVDWTVLNTSETAGLAPGESVDIIYTITVPECAITAHQWMAVMASEASEQVDEDGMVSAMRMGALVNLEIEGNQAESCGGAMEDVSPYVWLKYKDEDGNEATHMVRADSEEALNYNEDVALGLITTGVEEESAAAAQNGSKGDDNTLAIVAVVIGVVAVVGLVAALVVVLVRGKNGGNNGGVGGVAGSGVGAAPGGQPVNNSQNPANNSGGNVMPKPENMV